MTGQTPACQVVVVNWNGWDATIRALESLWQCNYRDFGVTVVDNGSTDGSRGRILAWAATRGILTDHARLEDRRRIRNIGCGEASLTVLASGSNLGFCGACNEGIAEALGRGARFVFLLNSDALVATDALGWLVSVALNADASVVAARVFDFSRKKVLFEGRAWPHELFGIGQGLNHSSEAAFWPCPRADGCAMLLRRDLLEKRLREAGHVFDPALFMYYEEVDLCRYAAAQGFRCVVARDAHVFHEPGGSSGGMGNARSYYYLTRNRLAVARKWLPPALKPLFHLLFAPSRLILAARWVPSHGWSPVRAVLAGLRDGYSGRSGKWERHDD